MRSTGPERGGVEGGGPPGSAAGGATGAAVGRTSAIALAALALTGGLLVLAPSALEAQEAGGALELTLENIHTEGGGVASAKVSPDGGYAALMVNGEEGPEIRLLPLDGSGSDAPPAASLRAGTRAPAQRAVPRRWVQGRSPDWHPSGEEIVFVREGALWRVGIGETKGRRLTPSMEGLRDPVFSPTGDRVAFYATVSGHQDIWLVPTDGSRETRQLTDGAMSVDDPRFEPSWSPDGRWIAYVSNAADYWEDDAYRVETETGDVRRLTWSLMASSTPRWSPSGDRIALMGTAKAGYWYQDLSDIWLIDPREPRSERKLPMQVWASDHGMRNDLFWSRDGSRIFFPYMERGDYDVWSVPAEGEVATRVTNLGGAMGSFDVPSSSREAVYFVREGHGHGDELYRVRTSGGPAERITRLTPEWETRVVPREVSYESFDGLYIQGFLYVPPGMEEGESCPAIVQVHGGGTNSYLRGQNLTEQYLASRGFVVFAINYRGGSGFGRAFQDLGVEDWLNRQAKDPGAAADWLRALPMTTDLVGIYGGSYGGMQSMAAITRTPEKFDAAVPMRGIYSERATFEEQDRLGKIFTKTGHGGLPHERPEIYDKSETISRFHRIETPVLIMHGEEDVRAPYRNYRIAVEKLRELGKEFEAKSYPGQGHGFSDPEARINMYRRLRDFLRGHLGSCE